MFSCLQELTEEKAALLASDAKAMAQYLLKQNEDGAHAAL